MRRIASYKASSIVKGEVGTALVLSTVLRHYNGANEGNRTRVEILGSSFSAIDLEGGRRRFGIEISKQGAAYAAK
jgi:hypothetical protein